MTLFGPLVEEKKDLKILLRFHLLLLLTALGRIRANSSTLAAVTSGSELGTKLGVIMVIAVSCVKLLSAHNSTQHTSRKHKV